MPRRGLQRLGLEPGLTSWTLGPLMYTGLKYSRPALRPDAINLDVPDQAVCRQLLCSGSFAHHLDRI